MNVVCSNAVASQGLGLVLCGSAPVRVLRVGAWRVISWRSLRRQRSLGWRVSQAASLYDVGICTSMPLVTVIGSSGCWLQAGLLSS